MGESIHRWVIRPLRLLRSRDGLVLLFVLALAGCGGGDGGNAGDVNGPAPTDPAPPGSSVPQTGPPLPSASYNGKNSAAPLDEAHAANESAAMVVALQSQLQFTASAPGGYSSAVIDKTQAGGVGGSAQIQGRFDDQGNGWLTIQFNDYQNGAVPPDNAIIPIPNVTITGTEIVWVEWSGPSLSSRRITTGFDNVRIRGPEYDYTYTGKLSRFDNFNYLEFHVEATANYVIHNNSDDTEIALREFAVTESQQEGHSSNIQIESSGQICMSALGCWNVTTPLALLYHDDPVGSVPFDGRLYFDSDAGPPGVGLAALNRNYASVGVDSDGDGAMERAALLEWDTLQLSAGDPAATPLAFAGRQQQVAVGDTVALQGGFSRSPAGKYLSYDWYFELVPVGSEATLKDPESPVPDFVADKPGEYLLGLTVSDGVLTGHDSVIVEASAENESRQPASSIAGANIGPDRKAVVGEQVTLDGRASSASDGRDVSYRWILNAPPGSQAVLDDTTSATPTFVPDVAGFYTARLVVDDDATTSDSITISVGTAVRFDPLASLTLPKAGDTAGTFAIGDIDQDGLVDFVAAQQTGTAGIADAFGVLKQVEPGRFSVGGTYSAPDIDVPVLADLNGDGLPDVVTQPVHATGFRAWFPQQSDGTFGPAVNLPVQDTFCAYGTESAAVDFDGDGRQTLAIASQCNGSYTVALLALQSDGTFAPPDNITVAGSGVAGIASGDVTGDGRPDLVVIADGGAATGTPGRLTVLSQSTGATGASVAQTLDLAVPFPRNACAGDLNGDGRNDAAVVDSQQVEIYLQDEAGQLRLDAVYPLTLAGDGAVVADVDGDGRAGLIVSDRRSDPELGTTPVIGLFTQQADGTLAPERLYPAAGVSPDNQTPMRAVDLNDDNIPDLVYPGDNGVSVLFGARF